MAPMWSIIRFCTSMADLTLVVSRTSRVRICPEATPPDNTNCNVTSLEHVEDPIQKNPVQNFMQEFHVPLN